MNRFLLPLLLPLCVLASTICPWRVLVTVPQWGIALTSTEAWKQMQMAWRYGARDAKGETSRKFYEGARASWDKAREALIAGDHAGFLDHTAKASFDGMPERDIFRPFYGRVRKNGDNFDLLDRTFLDFDSDGKRLLEPYVLVRVTQFLGRSGALPKDGEIKRELTMTFPNAATRGQKVTCTATAGFRNGELVKLDLEWGPITEAQQKAIREEQLHWLDRLREAKSADETILAAAQLMKLTMATLQYHRGSSGIAHARLVLALEAKGFRVGAMARRDGVEWISMFSGSDAEMVEALRFAYQPEGGKGSSPAGALPRGSAPAGK